VSRFQHCFLFSWMILLVCLDKAGVGVQVSNQLINSLLFFDDITLIANSEQELNTLLDITSKFADKWKLKFNDTKSKVMVVSRRIDREKVWKLGDNCIHETNEYKYLGVYVTRTLKSNYHVQTYIKDNMDNKIKGKLHKHFFFICFSWCINMDVYMYISVLLCWIR
jgi:hypothetical protein